MNRIVILLAFFLTVTFLKAQDIIGQWNGDLSVWQIQGEKKLRLFFHIIKDANGYSATMDSPDQGSAGIPVTTTTFDGSELSLVISNYGISYKGEFKTDSIVGTFKQAMLIVPMTLKRKTESLSQKEIEALKKYIYPLRTYEPDGGDTKDIRVLDKLIGSSKVVALGEVSHGSNEIYKMKNRIIQYLAANDGFDIFSIEANMPESYKLNDYTVRGEGDPKKLIRGMYFWTWATKEMLNMVEWMRNFNQLKQHIEFTGFDMQYYDGSIDELLKMFKGNEEVENKITELKKTLDVIRTRAKQKRGIVDVDDNEMKEIDLIMSFLQNSIETSILQTSDKEWLQQNIVIIRQFLGLKNIPWRDKCMADNFMWIKEHNPNSKFIIWAHNAHIQKTYQMMGYYLTQKLGNDYTTFGFTFFDGNFTATGSNGLTSYEAAKADPGTLEYLLNQLNEPIFILDLKKIKSENNKETEWLLDRLAYRSVGAVGGESDFHRIKITDDFDYLIFIKTSTPSTRFPDTW